jgi:hypothetical protein
MNMKVLAGLIIVLLTASAYAQSAQPNVTAKPPAKAKPQAAAGCKFVGTVKGTKLWAGDCADAAGLRGSDSASPSLTDQPGSAISPGQKQ